LKTNCEKCTKQQKLKALKVITTIYYKTPNNYIALAEKYDPTGEYTKRFEDWFDEQNAFNDLNETIETKNSSDISPIISDNNQGVLMMSLKSRKQKVMNYFDFLVSINSNTQNRRDSDKTSEPTKISLILASMTTTTDIPVTTTPTVRISLRTTVPSARTTTNKNENHSPDHIVSSFKYRIEIFETNSTLIFSNT
jgi:Insect pheromone-binding family, A10/OS-D